MELSNSGLKNIEGLINGEYEIDRNEFLEKITKDNERYISIQGGAGSGKSVLCKKYVENEKLVLYARAERFLEESHIDDIWGCCIQDVLECINGKKLIFMLSSLLRTVPKQNLNYYSICMIWRQNIKMCT